MAYDGAPSAPEPSASPTIAPSTAVVDNHEDPPPLYPSAARAKDCPPDSERGGLRFDARQHWIERQLGNEHRKSLGVACLVSASARALKTPHKMIEPRTRATASRTRAGTRRTRPLQLMTRLMTTMTMVTKPWQLSLLQKRYTSPRRREDRAVSSAPGHRGGRGLARGLGVGTTSERQTGRPTWPTCSRIILLVFKPGRRSKRQCSASCRITRYVSRHISICHGAPRATRTRTRETARTRARRPLLADAASPANCIVQSPYVGNGPYKPKDGTAPIQGPKGFGQLS